MTLKTLPLLEVIIVAALCLFNHSNATDTLVRAKKGGSAVLTCGLLAPDKGSSTVQHVLEWVRQGYDIPILMKFGVHTPRVHPNYDGRASLIGVTSLQIKDLRLEDEGWYECRILPLDYTTDEAGINGISTLLSVTAPPVFTETPPAVVEVFVGRSLTLNCASNGNPRPAITWSKMEGPLKSQNKLKTINGSLSFHAVSRGTSGQYQCLASNAEGNVTHITQLKVIGPPVIIIPPTDTLLNMSQDAKLKCQAEADPPNMTYVWQRDGENVHHIESLKSRVKVIVDGTLLISRLTPGDSGNYTCTPTNGLPGSPSASAILTVQYPAQVVQMPTLTFLPTGMRGVISCPFRAEPPLSHIDWIKDGQPLDLGLYPGWTLTSDGSIVIATANDDAAGVYTCTPYNSFGTMGQSEPTTVILQDPPSFKVSPRNEYRQEVGKMLVLPCQMNGNPAPKVTWKKVGAASRSLSTVAPNGSLILQPLSKDHQGAWECSSTNRVATVSARTTVLVLGTSPHAASSVSVVPGMNQANVSWVAGFDGGYTQKFTVWFRQISAMKKDEKQEWLSFPVLSSENCLLVTNLLPATEYQFSVMAQNKVGTGPFSEITTSRTLDGLPVVTKLDPPTILSVNQSSKGILLWWSVPQATPIDGFVIQSRLEGGEWYNLKEDISANKTHIFLGGLCKDCKYELRLLSRRGDQLSMPSPLINVSTIGTNMHPTSSRRLDLPDHLMVGVMGGVGFICLALILTLAIVCLIGHRRRRRRRRNAKDLPPALNKNPSVKGDLGSPDGTLKQKLLPTRPLSSSSSSSGHSSLEKSSHNDIQAQRQQHLPQANPPYHHSLPESHLHGTSLDPMSSVEFIHRGPDGRFIVQPCEDVNVPSSHIKRNPSRNSHRSSVGSRSFLMPKSQSLRSYKDERNKPPFVLSVDLPPFGSDLLSSSRQQAMVKHLSLNSHYMPSRELEFLDETDQSSFSSDSSGSLLFTNSVNTLGRQSLKRGTVHSAASTLVLQMEHEREQGNLSRCLTLAREREELERELRKYSVEWNPSSHGRSDYEDYGEIWKTRETLTPQSNSQAMRQSLLSVNTGIVKGSASSSIPWEAKPKISSASLVPLHTSYGKDNKNRQNQHGYHSIQRSNYQKSRSLDRGERKKSHTWDQRRSRTPVDMNLGRETNRSSVCILEKTKAGIGHSQKTSTKGQQFFNPCIYSSSNIRGRTIERSTRGISSTGDYSEMSVDGPDLESQLSPYSRSIVESDHSYETLDYDRPRLSELEKDNSVEQKLESSNKSPRRNQERLNSWSSRTMSPVNGSGTLLRKTKSLGSNNWNRNKSTHSLDTKLYKDQFLTPDAWIDSLTLGRDSAMSPFASRPNSAPDKPKSSSNLQKDSLVPSGSQSQNPHRHSKSPGGSINDSESHKNQVLGHSTALSPGGSSWPLSYCPSLSSLPSGSRNQSQIQEREEEEEDVQGVDVEINRYRQSSETEGSYRSYASQSSGRGSLDHPNSREFSLSPPLTSSPETTEDSDRDEGALHDPELHDRARRASVDESYEWDSHTYVPMHPVDPKTSKSKAGLQEVLHQGKLYSSTKDDCRSDSDLKQNGLFLPAGLKGSVPLFVAPTILPSRCEALDESLLAKEIRQSSKGCPDPEPDTVLF